MSETYKLKRPDYIKDRKRIGRGPSSGSGKTSSRGQKGQMSRSGNNRRAWFEGGQMPIQRRVPKRGFNNIVFKKVYETVNLNQLAKIEANTIDAAVLLQFGMIKEQTSLVKILGTGDISRAYKIEADAFSATAREKITKAGGEVLVKKKAQKKPKGK